MTIESPAGGDRVSAPAGLNGLLSRTVKGFRIRQALRELSGARSILDLGCGLCEITASVASTVRYTGVEREPWMLDRARRLFPERRFLGADLEDPAFDPGEPADRLLLLAVWEHLSDPVSFLRRARGWVAQGGRIVLTTPAPRGAGILDFGSRMGLLSRHADDEHERLWTIDEIRAAGESSGWSFHHARTFLFGLNQLVVLERTSGTAGNSTDHFQEASP